MLKSLAIISLLAFSFIPIFAEQQINVIPDLSSKIAYGQNDTDWYFYNFDMNPHNQTITLQSIEFVINNTDMSLYNVGNSLVSVEGHSPNIPLSNMSLYTTASDVIWSYNYSKPLVFTSNTNSDIAKFGLALSIFPGYTENFAVKINVHYLTTDGQKITVTSQWLDLEQPQLSTSELTEGTNFCTEGCDWPVNKGIWTIPDFTEPISKSSQDENQKIIQQNQVIEQQNTELITLQKQYNKLLATQICSKDFMVQALDGIAFLNGFNQCVQQVLEVSK